MIEKIPGLRNIWPYFDGMYKQQFPILHAWHSEKTFSNFEQEILLLPYLVKPTEIAIDVGANLGMYTSSLLRITPKVEAFEPNKDLASFLNKRFRDRANIHSLALSDTEGEALLELNFEMERNEFVHEEGKLKSLHDKINKTNSTKLLTISTRTLDSFNFKNIGFIKIDVEGHEISVLKGAYNTLLESQPSLLIEAELRHQPDAINALTTFLGKFGYQGFFLNQGKLMKISSFCRSFQDQSNLHTSGWGAKRRYINNFIYIPELRKDEFFNKFKNNRHGFVISD